MSNLISKRGYIDKLANNLTKITMIDFFNYIHINYYPEQDISFMQYLQNFLNNYTTKCEDDNYIYTIPVKTKIIIGGNQFSQNVYQLQNIKNVFNRIGNMDGIDTMVKNKVISKNDLTALKYITEVENLDTLQFRFEEIAEIEDEEVN
jgi:hypothetical protein